MICETFLYKRSANQTSQMCIKHNKPSDKNGATSASTNDQNRFFIIAGIR
jgi:hypothetical protein